MTLIEHAKRELKLAGLEGEYDGLMEKAVLDLIALFASQGHSGYSAHFVIEMFEKLARYKTLSPITNSPDEWMDRSEYQGGNPCWQNNRNSALFSTDGGQTYYDIDEKCAPGKMTIHKSKIVC